LRRETLGFEWQERQAETDADPAAGGSAPELPDTYEALLRELVDERTYPWLYRLAWTPGTQAPPSEREEFLFGINLILDGVQALTDRAG
jgi:hypothetical protein